METTVQKSPLSFKLPFGPLSVNKMYRGGRRFKTTEYERYVRDICRSAPNTKLVGEVAVTAVFHVRNYARADLDNMLKGLFDALTHAGIYEDDRKIVSINAMKCPTDTEEWMELEIVERQAPTQVGKVRRRPQVATNA